MACWKGPVEILKVTHASYGIEACLRQHMCGPHEDATGFQMNQTSEQNNTASQAHSKLKPDTKLSFIAIPGWACCL